MGQGFVTFSRGILTAVLVIIMAYTMSVYSAEPITQANLESAIVGQNIERLKEIIRDYKNESLKLDLNAALFKASSYQNGEVISLLIAAGADTESRGAANGLTPLWNAILNRNDEATYALIRAGADVRAKDKSGETAYHRMFAETCHGDHVNWKKETSDAAHASYYSFTAKKGESGRLENFECPNISLQSSNSHFKIEKPKYVKSSSTRKEIRSDGTIELVCEGRVPDVLLSGELKEDEKSSHCSAKNGKWECINYGFANYPCPKTFAVAEKAGRIMHDPSDEIESVLVERVPNGKDGGRVTCESKARSARMVYRLPGDQYRYQTCTPTREGWACEVF